MEARKNLSDGELTELTKKADYYVKKIRAFKLDLLRQHLVGNIGLRLPPTFLNHMLNELNEYLRILSSITKEQSPAEHPVHYHLLWLRDGAGHADIIASSLDDIERRLRLKAREFNMEFENLYLKASEISGYLRAGIARFPALDRFNGEAEEQMRIFMEFLSELLELRLSKKVLGTILPLILDHMLREECYYLTKLSAVSLVKNPQCNPGKPRLEE